MKPFPDNTPDMWYHADVQEAANSHDYDCAEDGVTGIWTELLPEQDWTALEKEWAAAADASVVDVTSNLMVEGESSGEDPTFSGGRAAKYSGEAVMAVVEAAAVLVDCRHIFFLTLVALLLCGGGACHVFHPPFLLEERYVRRNAQKKDAPDR